MTTGDATAWPSLPIAGWADTYAALHRWMQIVGKVRLAQGPWLNHSWHATFYPTARGLTTGLIPYASRAFELEFDFTEHRLEMRVSDGRRGTVPLAPQSVAAFHRRVLDELAGLGLPVTIHGRPNEIAEAIPFAEDRAERPYDRDAVYRFWQVLLHCHRVFTRFRAGFIGKCSPVHVFWGAPDLAVTRFSGRPAPMHPGGVPNLPDRVAREAYSHEVSSCGFWPGAGAVDAAFYAYAYPEPPGFPDAAVAPRDAFYSRDLREFLLPYDAVARSAAPDDMLLEFLETTYAAAADLGRWERAALERRQT